MFAVRRGETTERIDVHYHKPEYRLNEILLRKHYPDIRRLDFYADVSCGPFGTAIKLGDYHSSGVPLLRISNITKQGTIDTADLTFLSEEKVKSLARYQVSPGDLVISQRGTLGMPAIVPKDYPVWIVSANLIAIRTRKEISSSFVQKFLSSELGRKHLERRQSGQVQGKITTEDVASILIPKVDDETTLIQELEAVRTERQRKLAQAEALLTEIDVFVLEQLGLEKPKNSKSITSVHFSDIDGPLNPERYLNLYLERSIEGIPLAQVVRIRENKINPAKKGDESLWNVIRIDDLPNIPLGVDLVREEIGSALSGTFFRAEEGDVLLARLGPTILNSKIVLCPKTKYPTIVSPEFLVLRCKEGWHPVFVQWVLRTNLYKKILYSKGRGGTPSRYRLIREDLAKIPFPNIEFKLQETIGDWISDKLSQIQRLREEAETEWRAAKMRFERALLGEVEP